MSPLFNGLETQIDTALEVCLFLSVLIQIVAAAISVSLIRITKYSIAWISITAGFLLMAIRRVIDLVDYLVSKQDSVYDISNAWLAVIISVIMLVASLYIQKMLHEIARLNRIKAMADARVAAAIVTVEERERKNLAKELHDGLGPVLSIMRMLLSSLKTDKLDEITRNKLKKVNESVDYGVQSIYEISNQLSPKELERGGLLKAIKGFLQCSGVSDSIRFKLNSNIQDKRFNKDIEIVLFRIFCELLNNTVKHAKAHSVSLSLYSTPELLIFIYTDDGVGFNPEHKEGLGMGLLNIQTRAKAIGGKVFDNSSVGKGVFVNIDVCLKRITTS